MTKGIGVLAKRIRDYSAMSFLDLQKDFATLVKSTAY